MGGQLAKEQEQLKNLNCKLSKLFILELKKFEILKLVVKKLGRYFNSSIFLVSN